MQSKDKKKRKVFHLAKFKTSRMQLQWTRLKKQRIIMSSQEKKEKEETEKWRSTNLRFRRLSMQRNWKKLEFKSSSKNKLKNKIKPISIGEIKIARKLLMTIKKRKRVKLRPRGKSKQQNWKEKWKRKLMMQNRRDKNKECLMLNNARKLENNKKLKNVISTLKLHLKLLIWSWMYQMKLLILFQTHRTVV